MLPLLSLVTEADVSCRDPDDKVTTLKAQLDEALEEKLSADQKLQAQERHGPFPRRGVARYASRLPLGASRHDMIPAVSRVTGYKSGYKDAAAKAAATATACRPARHKENEAARLESAKLAK